MSSHNKKLLLMKEDLNDPSFLYLDDIKESISKNILEKLNPGFENLTNELNRVKRELETKNKIIDDLGKAIEDLNKSKNDNKELKNIIYTVEKELKPTLKDLNLKNSEIDVYIKNRTGIDLENTKKINRLTSALNKTSFSFKMSKRAINEQIEKEGKIFYSIDDNEWYLGTKKGLVKWPQVDQSMLSTEDTKGG